MIWLRTVGAALSIAGVLSVLLIPMWGSGAYSTQSEQPFQLIVNAAEKSAAAAADCRQLFTMMCRRGEL